MDGVVGALPLHEAAVFPKYFNRDGLDVHTYRCSTCNSQRGVNATCVSFLFLLYINSTSRLIPTGNRPILCTCTGPQ